MNELPTGPVTILGVDVAQPGGDHTVKATLDADGKVIHVERIDAPREPAPPVGANTVKVTDESSTFGPEQLAAVRAQMAARMTPPEMELVGINGKPIAAAVQPAAEITIHAKPQRQLLPPGIDIHRVLKVNTNTCRGKMGKRAARMQLKDARREQKRLLKAEGYFDKKPQS